MAHGSSGGSSPGRKPALMLYGMYDASVPASAPRVRIAMLADALGRQARLVRADRGRWRRLFAQPRVVWQLWRVDAVYVESPTSAAMPWDLLILGLARLLRRPVGVYFRDAYQLYRDLYPARSIRQRLSDTAWKVSLAALRRIATVRFAPSSGLAKALSLRAPVLLPPGTDPSQPDLGTGAEPLIAYVGGTTSALGFDRLLEAMELVRREVPAARLLVITPDPGAWQPPPWVELRHASRDGLADLLGPAAACVLPLPINRYTDLAIAVRLSDYLSWGKPIVATATVETRALLEPGGAGLLVSDEPAAIAAGLVRVLNDHELATKLGAAARAVALSPSSTWDARAGVILDRLLGRLPAT